MSDAHALLITRFYQAFQRLDAEAMAACYTDDVVFRDLTGYRAGSLQNCSATQGACT